MTNACKHHYSQTYGPYPYQGCVAIPGKCDERSHGWAMCVERCRECGAQRAHNENQGWVEVGPWFGGGEQ